MRWASANKSVPRLSTRHPSGMTLLELMVSMVATSVLLAGMSSAVFLASRAAQPDSPAMGTIEASLTARQIATELSSAKAIVENTSTSIKFVVADRDKDGAAETIRYAWTGTEGDALTRQYNGGTVVDVLENVHAFGLTYHIESDDIEAGEWVEEESAEQVLAEYDTVGNTATYDVKTDFWPGQWFLPSLGTDVVHWRVTRVEAVLKKETAGQMLHVQLRSASNGTVPATSAIEEVIVKSDSLADTFDWRSFRFNNVSRLHPDQGLLIVLTDDGAGFPAMVKCLDTAVSVVRLGLVTSANQGANWTAIPTTNFQFRVWGTVTTMVDTPLTVRGYLNRVDLALQVGSSTHSHVQTAVHLHNAPEVTVASEVVTQ